MMQLFFTAKQDYDSLIRDGPSGKPRYHIGDLQTLLGVAQQIS